MSGGDDRGDRRRLATGPETTRDPTPPEKWIAQAASGYTLVLFERGPHRDRLRRAIDRICREPERAIDPLLDGPCPAVVRRGLSLDEAIAGQFELISCDSVSVFVRDGVAAHGSRQYLGELYRRLRLSPEFRPVIVAISFIPDSDGGRRFCDQFLAASDAHPVCFGRPIAIRDLVFQKKARNMAHWAKEIGVSMIIDRSAVA
jgi:hypothetical protein